MFISIKDGIVQNQFSLHRFKEGCSRWTMLLQQRQEAKLSLG